MAIYLLLLKRIECSIIVNKEFKIFLTLYIEGGGCNLDDWFFILVIRRDKQ